MMVTAPLAGIGLCGLLGAVATLFVLVSPVTGFVVSLTRDVSFSSGEGSCA